MKASQLLVSPLKRPEKFNFATHVVDHWARKLPAQNALYWVSQDLSSERRLTYQHFSRQSHRIASLLTGLGVRQGEVCIIILPRVPAWWEITTACLRAGIIMCPCTTLLVDKDIEYRLQVSNAAAFVGDAVSVAKCLKVRQTCSSLRTVIQVDHDSTTSTLPNDVVNFERRLAKVPQDQDFTTPGSVKPDSPGLMFFTSGTTGPPKMVLHTQVSYPLAHALTGIHWLRLTPTKDSVYWNLSEQGWAKAAWSFFSTWNCGATLFVHDDRQAFDPRRTLQVLHKFPISTLCAPPTVYRQLVLEESQRFFASTDGRPRALKHACGAGEPLNESVIRTWKEMNGGMDICDGYGQTETILVCANQAGHMVKPGSMGQPIPGVPLRVIDSNGKETSTEEEGDIAVEVVDGTPGHEGFFGLFEGYVKDMKTRSLDRRIKEVPGGKRYYITGDRATRDGDGYLWFVGRNDDVINSSGYRIGPFEVESTLKLHPAVVESAVVAAPDPKRDEVIKAFIVLTQAAHKAVSASTDKVQVEQKLIKELQDFCKKNAAPYKYPRQIEFVDASFLPKTISGKIKRAELKRLERDRYRASQKGPGAKL